MLNGATLRNDSSGRAPEKKKKNDRAIDIPPQMSMMPRFVNTMRLTQAVYETAASILVTVSTVKSFPALMTLPFADQVMIAAIACVTGHVTVRLIMSTLPGRPSNVYLSRSFYTLPE